MKYTKNYIRLKEDLKIIESNFIIGLAGVTLLNNEDARNCLYSNNQLIFLEKDYDFSSLKILFANDLKGKETTKNFFSMVIRTSVKEAFEMIKSYCEFNNNKYHKNIKSLKIENQSFYNFSLLLRNVLSHNMVFDLKGYSLPIVWNGIDINEKRGKEINKKQFETLTEFNVGKAYELLREYWGFINLLNPNIKP